MPKKISIVIPAYNDGLFVKASIESALSQTYENIEVVVVDDGSTDSTREIIKECASSDLRIKALYSEKNEGSLRARMKGVDAVSGDYVMFLDADDDLESFACQTVVDSLNDKDADIIHFQMNVINEADLNEKQVAKFYEYYAPYSGNIDSELLLEGCFIDKLFCRNLCGKIFRSDILKKLKKYVMDEYIIFGEDMYILFLYLFFAKVYKALPEPGLYNYHRGRGMMQGYFDSASYNEFCRSGLFYTSLEGFLKSQGAFEKRKQALYSVADILLNLCLDRWANPPASVEAPGADTLFRFWKADTVLHYFKTQNEMYTKTLKSQKVENDKLRNELELENERLRNELQDILLSKRYRFAERMAHVLGRR